MQNLMMMMIMMILLNSPTGSKDGFIDPLHSLWLENFVKIASIISIFFTFF